MLKPWCFISFLTFAAAVASVGCQPAGEVMEEAVTEESMEDSLEASVQALADEYAAAWNAGDAEGIAALYTADADSSGPDGEIYTGRQQIAEHYRELLEGADAGTTISIRTTSTRELEPGVVLVNGGFEVTGSMGAEGEEMPPAKGLSTVVLVQDGDTWRIASLRSWIPVKAPGTT